MRTANYRNAVSEVVPVAAALQCLGLRNEWPLYRGVNASEGLADRGACSVSVGHVGRLDAQINGEAY